MQDFTISQVHTWHTRLNQKQLQPLISRKTLEWKIAANVHILMNVELLWFSFGLYPDSWMVGVFCVDKSGEVNRFCFKIIIKSIIIWIMKGLTLLRQSESSSETWQKRTLLLTAWCSCCSSYYSNINAAVRENISITKEFIPMNSRHLISDEACYWFSAVTKTGGARLWEEETNGNDYQRLLNDESSMWTKTKKGSWDCLIQHLEPIFHFLIFFFFYGWWWLWEEQ